MAGSGHTVRLPRWYTPFEVACHNTATDCWVSILGEVYDLSKLIKNHPGLLVEPIIAAAGTDISHWFDDSGGVRTQVDPDTQLAVPYCPQGAFLHVLPSAPLSNLDCSVAVPWWRDVTLRVGRLSSRTQLVQLKNVLTEQEDALEVPSEETLGQVRERYLGINAHAASYTWKALLKTAAGGYELRELDLNKTLHEAGVMDEAATFESLDLPPDCHVPTLLLYFNDDLTVA